MRGTYLGYSVGCAVIWAMVLTMVALTSPDRLQHFLIFAGGWLIGWISATIARSYYPPPGSGR